METEKNKLHKISDAWNYFFLETEFLQKQINYAYDEDIKTNYYGDILHYFLDTFGLITDENFKKSPDNHVFNAIGLMQSIYIHQDLMDELLYIFKLPASVLKDKTPNRTIRNELIGHPIRKLKNELQSSVLFRFDSPTNAITYVLYEKANNFKGKIVNYSTDSIIKNHSAFLNKYFDVMLRKICAVFIRYNKKLDILSKLIEKGVAFDKLLNYAKQFAEQIFKSHYIFDYEYLLDYYQKRHTHPRYQNAVDQFLINLKEFVKDKQEAIEQFINPKELSSSEIETVVRIRYITLNENEISEEQEVDQVRKQKENIHYELSKLAERNPVFGIQYFKRKFQDCPVIFAELLHMEDNNHDDKEYYAAFEYIKPQIEYTTSDLFYK
ncbi:hypothetical protein [Foetidibacter luteolus]|uniref:hypothetical protein n=1 Tax=Foetidibacter luteolus TaxID=2608880 RepID=UPI00129BB444|nr:hypothetical protein [Foetidibacter luteolus]